MYDFFFIERYKGVKQHYEAAFFDFSFHIGIVEKAKETNSGMHNRAIPVLHEQWMCPGMQRHTHITLCSMVTL